MSLGSHIFQLIEGYAQRVDVGIVGVAQHHRAAQTLGQREAHICGLGLGESLFGGLAVVAQQGIELLGHLERVGGCNLVSYGCHSVGDVFARRVINYTLGAAEQHRLLGSLVSPVDEVLVVLRAKRGEDAYVGPDHRLQACHLVGARNAGLDYGQILVALDHQQRQRHAQLRVVAPGRAKEPHTIGGGLCNPLLHGSFARRAGDGHHLTSELRAVVGCQLLERHQRAPYHHKSRLGIEPKIHVMLDHKGPHASTIEVAYKAVPVVVYALDSHKYGHTIGCKAVARVSHHAPGGQVGSHEPTARNLGNLSQCVIHNGLTSNV